MVGALLSVARGRVRRLVASVLVLSACLALPVLADAPPSDVFPTTGAFNARLQGSRNNVAIVELSGDYSRDLASGLLNVEPRTEVAKEFYRRFADRYDFIVVFSNFEFQTGDAKAFYLGVKNDTRGLGMPMYDNTSYFGSQGALQGYIDMAALSRYNLEPGDPRFEEVMRVLSHEFLHRWAARVRFVDGAGQLSNALLGRDGSHWSFLLDTGGSVQYGNRWADNGGGSFTSRPDRQFFSALDLYLMGMLRKEEVPPFFLIDSADAAATRLTEVGVTVSGTRRDVTVDQIIAAEGERLPHADNSQKQFRFGFVLLTRPGVTPTDAEVQSVNAVRQAFETRLTTLTAGKALAHGFLEPRQLARQGEPTISDPVVGTPGSSANVLNALNWLRGRQQEQGEWYDNPLTRMRDTVVATATLADVGPGDAAAVERATAWLTAQPTSNTDYVARRISALATRATEADWLQLAAGQNPDGGWGAAPGYQSTPLDTSLAVIALALDPNPTRQALARERAKAFLLSKQNADGGWSHAVNGASRTSTTAQVIRALASLNAAPQINTAALFLARRQNVDGGFGDSPSTTHDTSNVILSLATTGQLGAVRALDGFNFLHGTQQPNGSWDTSVYATSLAIRTLGSAQTYNWSASSLQANPAAVRDGQRVALTLLVTNTGTVAAPASSVTVYDGDVALGAVVGVLPVPPLEPGRASMVQGSWSTLNRPGNHLLTAVVDATAQGVEMTRTDNTATVRVAVAPAPAGPDLTVSAGDVQIMPGVINRLPTTVSVVTQLTNIGQTDVLGARVRLLSGLTRETMVVVDEVTVNLLGRSSIAVTNSYQVTRPGRQLIAVVVEAAGAMADVDLTNNRADLQIDTISSFDPAITVADLVVPSGPVTLGSDVTLRATVHNHGTADTPPFQAILTVTDGTTVREIDRIAVQLAPGAERSFALPWRVDLTGPLQFRVVLDPAGAVADLDRSNNTASAAFTAGLPPAGPNLAVIFRDFLVQPDPANEGQPLTLRATIRNTGNQPAENVQFGFYEGNPTTGGVLLAPLQVLPSVVAGASVEVQALLGNVVGDGDRLYFVAVDPANTIAESTKEDNLAFRVVEVSSRPDLAVASGSIQLSPSAPRPGDTLNVAVSVQNLGQQPASGVLVRLLDGDSVLGEQTLVSVAPLTTHIASFSLTLSAQAAARSLSVIVDPANTVAEGDESNNTASRALTVQTGSAFVTEHYFSPNGDGVKDTVSFGFRLDVAASRVLVVNENDVVVRTFSNLGSGPQTDASVTWDGRDDFQRIAADGRYRFRAMTANGQQLAESSTVLDTNRTPILRASGTPAEYYRNLSCRAPGINDWTVSLDEQSLFYSVSLLGEPTTDVDSGIYRSSIERGEINQVVSPSFARGGGQGGVGSVSASARGDRVAFLRSNPRGLFTGDPSHPWQWAQEVWTAGGDGTGLRMLASSVRPADEVSWIGFAPIMSHDGTSVILIADSYSDQSRTTVRRYQVDPAGGGAAQVLYNSLEHNNARIWEVTVSPDRRRAVLRLHRHDTGEYTTGVLNLETGALVVAPAGLNFEGVKWAPDSQRFATYGHVPQTPGGVYSSDIQVDVFDANFTVVRRFRTDSNVPPFNLFYGYWGDIRGVEWSSDSDEVAITQFHAPGDTSYTMWTLLRAHVGHGTLTLLPPLAHEPGDLLGWAPNDRTLLAMGKESGHARHQESIHVDSAVQGELFPKWWRPGQEPNDGEMRGSLFAPSGRSLFFTSDRDNANPQSTCQNTTGGYSGNGAGQLFVYQSLHNLFADLQVLRDPRRGGVLLRGSAADIHFAGYRLEYANANSPNDWHLVAVPGTEEKFDADLASWVPPGYGTYFVRLTVQDRAGNSAQQIRRVRWDDTPAITDLIKNFDYISPNGDGVQDALTLRYRVLEPVHLAFEVRREDGSPVRLVRRDHASIGSDFTFAWDGRDDAGQILADGKYVLRVLDYEFPVEIDTVFPVLTVELGEHAHSYLPVARLQNYVRFDAESLRGATESIRFVVAPGETATASVEDLIKPRRVYRFGSGAHTLTWDGLDEQGRALPGGTYVVRFTARDSTEKIDVQDFTAELRRATGAPQVVIYPVLNAEGVTRVTATAADRLLDHAGAQVQIGWGDPPALWRDVVKNGQFLCCSDPLAEGWGFRSWQQGETDAGISTSTLDGSVFPLKFNGYRVRTTAKDKAGNEVSAVSPHRQARELVLEFGKLVHPHKTKPGVERLRTIPGTANFADMAALPAKILSDEPPPSPPGLPTLPDERLAFEEQARELRLNYNDNSTTVASRVELRYAVIPYPALDPAETERPPFVAPTAANMSLLQWTTVPIHGLLPNESATGISRLILPSTLTSHFNMVQFGWQLPLTQSGVLLFRLVTRYESGEETRSNVHFLEVASPPLPELPWHAYHEPALSCGAPVSEIARVLVTVPSYRPRFEYPYVVGQRLYRLHPDGRRELMFEAADNNDRNRLYFDSPFSTATWPVGRHDFEVQLRSAETGIWQKVASPYIYVNHVAPVVRIGAPVEGQRMCASRVPARGGEGTVGFLPFSVQVTEPYAAHQDLQILKGVLPPEHRSPIVEKRRILGTPEATSERWLSDWGDRWPDIPVTGCEYPDACGNSGPIIWPGRPGKFAHPPSMHFWGLAVSPFSGNLEPDPLNGETTARLRAYGPSGHLSCTAVTVHVDGLVDGSSGLERRLFSPNGDTLFDEVELSVSARESLTVKVEVLNTVQGTDGSIRPASGSPVATVVENLSIDSGDRLIPWNGRSSGGQVVPDGVYLLRVTLIDGCGNEKVEYHQVEVDNTPPLIVIDSPKPNDEVAVDFLIKGTITDLHPLRYELAGATDINPGVLINLPNLGNMNRRHSDLGSWNTTGLTGGARIVVRAFDSVGNNSLLELPVVLSGSAELISGLAAVPDPFSPNGDGRRERVSLMYTLTRAANVTLNLVRATTGAPIRTLLSAVPASIGNGSVVWDGRNEAGVVEPDEDVIAVLTAEVITNGEVSVRQVIRSRFVLDKTPPVITYTLPRGPVTSGAGGVVVRAADPLFAEASLSIAINGGAFASMAASQGDGGQLSAPLDDVPEGPVTLRVAAADRAENQSVGSLSVIIDRTPPKPRITAPLPNAYISGLRQPYSIEGSIEELHFASYQLSLGNSTLVEGTTLPSALRLLNWNPLTVADGPYTLTLRADDQAELTGSVSVPITVDNTPPVALIRSTGSPMYLRVGTVLNGTATDVNLQTYRVELAAGGSSSARWTEVARGTTAINDAALTTLSVLPADGVYGLRLTVIDRAGNESSAVQDVTVDTTAPQSLTLTAQVTNRRDGDVRWNAASEVDVAGYNLYRNGSRINTALLTATTYLDAGLAAGSYTYIVRAVDRAGNESDPSNEGRIVVTTSEPVAQIFAPTRDGYAAGLMDVRGTAMAPADFREYRLYIGNGAAPATWQLLRRSPLATTADTLSAWNTLGLTEGAQYTLKLEAEDLSGVVATDRVTVRVKNTPPAAPIQLQGTLTVNNIALTWTANTEPDLQGYLLYRDQRLANATGLVIGSLVPYLIRPAAYNDLGVPDGLHRYYVQAMDMAGNISNPSNEVEFLVDTRPPHVPVVKPLDGSSIGQTTILVGESPDTDIARVQFQYKPAVSSTWLNIGAPLTSNAGPWRLEWNTEGLPFGPYNVRAVATDQGNRTDPAPGFITLVVTDLRKPEPATTLTTLVTGGDVALNWVATPSSFAVGYHIERVNPDQSITQLTNAPVTGLTYTDVGRPDAGYTYRVYAVSAGETLSDPSNDAVAVVFTPTFTQPYTPTLDATTPLEGGTRAQHRVMLRTQGGAAVSEVASDETGAFRFDTVTLALGDNRFQIVAGDQLGNTSKPAPWHAMRGAAPAAPTGLNANVAGHDVTLTWGANQESDLEGYVPALAGVLRTSVAVPTTATASSVANAFTGADRAIDSEPYTGWAPANRQWVDGHEVERPANGQWIEVQLATPRLIEEVSLQWGEEQVPSRYRIEGFDGEVWVPLAHLQSAGSEPVIDVKFARTYRTNRLRVLLIEAQRERVQLNNIRLRTLDSGPQRSAIYTNLPDGRPSLGVIAVSNLGFASPLAQATPAVGDVTPPSAPVLQAVAAGSDAQLSWVGPNDADVAGFQIRRDGELIATLNDGALRNYVDQALPNAHYNYVVNAIDSVGNTGLASNVAGVDIAVAGPNAPITATATAPVGGGLVVVDWQVSAGPQPAAFLLRRAAAPSGPYTVLATAVPTSPYEDRAVENGVRYYYTVTGLDIAGNTGGVSNQVNALPLDRSPPATPYFVLPGRAPGPVLTDATQRTLVGIAEPGSRVLISKGDVQIGAVTALAQDLETSIQLNSVFDISPDGSLMYLPSESNGPVRYLDGMPVPSASLIGVYAPFRFAPDGRSAALLRHDWQSGTTTLMRWDRATDTLSSVSTMAESDLLAFSPDSRYVVSRAYDRTLDQSGMLIVDWGTGAARFVAGSLNAAAWSPDSQTIALADGTGLRLVDPLLTREVVVPGLAYPGWASWLPDGSALLVTHQPEGGNSSIVRLNVADLSVTALAEEAGVNFTSPVVSPDGSAYLAYRNMQLVRRSFTGQQVPLSEDVLTDYLPAPLWVGSKTIAYLRDWGELIIRAPAGQFTLPGVPLDVGSNLFGAYAVDATGNTSAPALPLEVRRASDNLPDWSVTEDSWFVFPATPQSGESTVVAVTVRNIGAAAPATPVSVIAVSAQGVLTHLFSGSLNPLAHSEQQVLRITWAAGLPGRYTLMVVVDPNDLTAEVSKDNNQAARELVVATATGEGRPELQVSTDKARYAGGETVTADVIAVNAGAPLNGSLVARVVDLGGTEVVRFDARPVQSLLYGQPQTFRYTWPSGSTFAGDYRITAELLDATAQPAANATANFAIDPGATFSAAVVTDRASYLSGDNVSVRGAVRYVSGNLLTAGAPVVLSVRSATGSTVATRSLELQGLLQGSEVQVDLSWPAGQIGPYTAHLWVGSEATPSASAQASFAVLAPTLPQLTGRLQVAGDVFATTEAIPTSSSVTNLGAVIDLLAVRVRAYDTTSGQTLATWAGELTGVGATPLTAAALLTGTWPLASFELRLEALVGGNWLVLDRARVQAAERTPPGLVFTSPAAGAIVRSSATVTTLATPRQAPVARVELLPGGSAWVAMLPQDASAGRYYSNALPTTDGPVTLQARAIDTLSNISSTVVLPLIIDNTPPLITVTGVVDQQVSSSALSPLISVTDVHLLAQTITLDGAPFVSGTPVGEGIHVLTISAVDRADNRSNATVQFTVQSQFNLRGSLDVPASVVLGDVVALGYGLLNDGSAALTDVPLTLRVIHAQSGAERAAFPLSTTLASGQAQGGLVNWLSTGEPGELTVVLSATVAGIQTILAQAPLQLTSSVDLTATPRLARDTRVLVLISCRVGQADDPACVQQRTSAVATALYLQGVPHRIVNTAAEFEAELRCGIYNVYWVSGGTAKLSEQALKEVREAVYRGDGLILEGTQDSNGASLRGVGGVHQYDWIENENLSTEIVSGNVFEPGPLVTLGRHARFVSATAQPVALFENYWVAMAHNRYGQGGSVVMAFDYAAMLAAPGSNGEARLQGMLQTALQHVAAAPTVLTVADLARLSTEVDNRGTSAVDVEARATLPDGVLFVDAEPAPTQVVAAGPGTPAQVVWQFNLAAGARVDLKLRQRLNTESLASVQIPVTLYSRQAGVDPVLQATANHELPVVTGLALTHAAFAAVQALAPTSQYDQSLRGYSMNAALTAVTWFEQGNAMGALTKWLTVADQLMQVTTENPATLAAARHSVAMAIEAATDRLCRP